MTQPGHYVLWGTPHSLYTGKVRSYLIKKGVPYRDMRPSNPDFGRRIAPLIGNFVVPVVETPDGRILQDSTDIIEHIEQSVPANPLIPDGAVQKAVAWLVDAFGSEALLPAAMHYRWSYRVEQEAFLRAEFGRSVYAGPDRAARDQAGRTLMDYFNDFLPVLGVTAATAPVYEAAYCQFLDALEQHFQCWPYVLGGRPSIADFGLMAPLYAHLARDPVPAALMKSRAPNVYRWTERMNLAEIPDGEFPGVPNAYAADDVIPESLEPALELMFRDWTPQLLADAACYNAWVSTDPSMAEGRLVSASGERKIHPTLGAIEFTWRGSRIQRASAPHGLWHFDRATTHARTLTGDAKRRFDEIVQRTGGTDALAIRVARPMKRENYALVIA